MDILLWLLRKGLYEIVYKHLAFFKIAPVGAAYL